MDITPDGRYVTFASSAADLVSDDTNEACDVFVYDVRKRDIERVSVSSLGIEAALGGASSYPTISGDGRYVAFHSTASNLVSPVTEPAAVDGNGQGDVFVHDRNQGTTELVSVAFDPVAPLPRSGSLASQRASISTNGLFVAFQSQARDLVATDPTPAGSDIYVRDLKMDETSIVSAPPERPGGVDDQVVFDILGSSGFPSINQSGRYVKFTTSYQLVPADTNLNADTYLYDVQKKTHELVSIGIDGKAVGTTPQTGSTGAVGARQISAEGRYVLFGSFSNGLVPNDQNGPAIVNGFDLFIRDRVAKRTERVSVTSAGVEGDAAAGGGSISPDGRYVTMGSVATNLAPEQYGHGTTSDADVYRYDRTTGELRFVSASSDGSEAMCKRADNSNTSTSDEGALSRGGRFLVFMSCAYNLVGDDTNDRFDFFLRDMGDDLGVGSISRSKSSGVGGGASSVFGDRGFVSVSDPVDGDEIGAPVESDLIEARIALRPSLNDLFAVLDVASMPPITTGGALYVLEFQVGDSRFEVRMKSIGPLLGAGSQLGLFDCSSSETSCQHVADLEGGIGTIGHSVAVSVPLDLVGLSHGGSLRDVNAFSGMGGYSTGMLISLDEIQLVR